MLRRLSKGRMRSLSGKWRDYSGMSACLLDFRPSAYQFRIPLHQLLYSFPRKLHTELSILCAQTPAVGTLRTKTPRTLFNPSFTFASSIPSSVAIPERQIAYSCSHLPAHYHQPLNCLPLIIELLARPYLYLKPPAMGLPRGHPRNAMVVAWR